MINKILGVLVILLGIGLIYYRITKEDVKPPITLIDRHTDTLYVKGKDSIVYKTKRTTDTVYVRFSGNCDSCIVALDTLLKKDSSSVRVYTKDLRSGLIIDMNIFEKLTTRVDTLKIKDSVIIHDPIVREWYDKPSTWVGIGALGTTILINLIK